MDEALQWFLAAPDAEFARVYAAGAFVAALGALTSVRQLRPQGTESSTTDPYDLAWLRAGARGAFEAAAAGLLHRRVIDTTGSGPLLPDKGADKTLRAPERAVLGWVGDGAGDVQQGIARVGAAMHERELELEAKGITIAPAVANRNLALLLAPLAAIVCLGGWKASRLVPDEAPENLALLGVGIGVLLLAMVVLPLLKPRLTVGGARALELAGQQGSALRHALGRGALSHLSASDVVFAVALYGMGPFLATELGAMYTVLHPMQLGSASSGSEGMDWSEADCGSGCGSSGCSGGCGSGCGGCGD